MEDKINIAELLKDCPKGMELDCTVFDAKVFYQGLNERIPDHPIVVQTEHGFEFELTQYGQIHNIVGSKCVIFTKGKTTWEGFVPLCQFTDGDVISDGEFIAIFHKFEDDHLYYHCWHNKTTKESKYKTDFGIGYYYEYTYATEEEKQKLFDAIKAHGYKWNAETKTLAKLPRFKVGDRVKAMYNGNQYDIKELTDTHYTLVEVEYKFKYTEPIIEDKHWELVPNKFDITTLKPFDKVLSRDNDFQKWGAELFSFYDKETKDYRFQLVGTICARRCIPFEGNQHLLGTTDDCDEYYKTWK
jgi:hypothetical protein